MGISGPRWKTSDFDFPAVAFPTLRHTMYKANWSAHELVTGARASQDPVAKALAGEGAYD